MSGSHDFPRDHATLTRAQMVSYLLYLQRRGWVVQQDTLSPFYFSIGLQPNMHVRLHHADSATRDGTQPLPAYISTDYSNYRRTVKTLPELQETLRDLLGDGPPQHVRTKKTTDATNLIAIVDMVGPAVVEAIYDPYLKSFALADLVTMKTLGIKITPNLRLLSSGRLIPVPGKEVKEFQVTRRFVQQVFSELGVTAGEYRYMRRIPHPRFFLLSGGGAIQPDYSFADSQDGNLHAVSDGQDRVLFEQWWQTAQPFYP